MSRFRVELLPQTVTRQGDNNFVIVDTTTGKKLRRRFYTSQSVAEQDCNELNVFVTSRLATIKANDGKKEKD